MIKCKKNLAKRVSHPNPCRKLILLANIFCVKVMLAMRVGGGDIDINVIPYDAARQTSSMGYAFVFVRRSNRPEKKKNLSGEFWIILALYC